MELPSCKIFYFYVNRKGIYFIWVMLKSRKAELEQLGYVSRDTYPIIRPNDERSISQNVG